MREGWSQMGTYVQLGEVKTWYDEHGSGDPLVLMHGGLVDARFFAPNLRAAGRALPRLHAGAARARAHAGRDPARSPTS